MLKVAIVFMASLFFYFPSFANGLTCKELQQTEGIELSPRLTYEVAGSGRLYFYTAPNEKCINKNSFVIPNDVLFAYEESGAWTQVTFNSKTGEPTSGWVKTQRLKFTGAFGMELTAENFQFYTDAAKVAKAGKLGSPFEKR